MIEIKQQSNHWRLRLSDETDWQHQYTGADPQLLLPKEFDNAPAMSFLHAQARFVDVLQALKPQLQELKCTYYSSSRAMPEELRERVFYNTSVCEAASPMFKWLSDYMSWKLKGLAIPKLDSNHAHPYDNYVRFFADQCRHHPEISARGYFEYLAERTKIQLMEPWLLYQGQTLEELRSWAMSKPQMPAEHLATIQAVYQAYQETGLNVCVERNRHWANSPLAQFENRHAPAPDMGAVMASAQQVVAVNLSQAPKA